MPEHHLLEDWGINPRKRMEAFFVWRDIDNGGAAVETLHLPAAYCTFYGEYFEQHNPRDGSYICTFRLSDPDGWD